MHGNMVSVLPSRLTASTQWILRIKPMHMPTIKPLLVSSFMLTWPAFLMVKDKNDRT